ncbi:alpha/beta hydrolase [Nevskia soli]|uniref:alpha/beta hydrolase n=1 Tax=Nevskia soli TaxID=418856 RepID=UPI0015D90AFD|nr:alpha/beta hydrolase [Nevskia soli]
MLKRLLFLTAVASALSAQQVIPIWPHGAPAGHQDAQPDTKPEADTTTAKDNLIAGKPLIRLGHVTNPTLTIYPPKGNNSGAAVVVFPGGGYSILAMDLEGTEVCDWLTSSGITCAVLKYRVPGSGPFPKSAAALQDAQRAMGIVRMHAAEWQIDPHRVGVLGFSAGGHLAAAVSTHYDERLYPAIDAADQQSCRPDFAIVIYPGYLGTGDRKLTLNPDVPVTDKTPPTILVQAEDDPVGVENAVAYFLALKAVKVPAELHLYASGGHGYGLRRTELPVTAWPDVVSEWLRHIRVIS